MSTAEQDPKEFRSVHYVSELMSMLMGKDMTLRAGEVFQLATDPGFIGTFVTEDGALGGVFICDLAFGAYAGCALSLVPAREAKAGMEAGELPDHVVDNLREIVNVSSRLYTTLRTPRVIFKELLFYPQKLDRELLGYLARPAERADFTCAIDGYGEGRFALIMQ